MGMYFSPCLQAQIAPTKNKKTTILKRFNMRFNRPI